MLNRMGKLIGMSSRASDGELGKVKDVYFDDHRWAVRYLIVDTGGWLVDRKVLISPIAIERVDWNKRSVQVRLTRQQVRVSPPIDTDKPVSRQHEVDFLAYYGYPSYWGGPFMWGTTSYPQPGPTATLTPIHYALDAQARAVTDPHLRSVHELSGYRLKASNGLMGHLEDLLVDSESWAIRYIVVDTRNWWPGKHVLISPQWITRVDWAERLVTLDVARDTVQSAPEYDPGSEYSRAHEASLHRHYQRPGYWQ